MLTTAAKRSCMVPPKPLARGPEGHGRPLSGECLHGQFGAESRRPSDGCGYSWISSWRTADGLPETAPAALPRVETPGSVGASTHRLLGRGTGQNRIRSGPSRVVTVDRRSGTHLTCSRVLYGSDNLVLESGEHGRRRDAAVPVERPDDQ